MEITNILKDFIVPNQKTLEEKSLSRIYQQHLEHDTGAVTAFRNEFSQTENRARNRKLGLELRNLGYSVTPVKGGYIENYKGDSNSEYDPYEEWDKEEYEEPSIFTDLFPTASQPQGDEEEQISKKPKRDTTEEVAVYEDSFFVSDINDYGHLAEDLEACGLEYNQDSVFIWPKDGNPYIIGTSRKPDAFPPRGRKMSFSTLNVGDRSDVTEEGYYKKLGQFFTRVKGKPYFFESAGATSYPGQDRASKQGINLGSRMNWKKFLKESIPTGWKSFYEVTVNDSLVRVYLKSKTRLGEALNAEAFWVHIGSEGIEVHEVSSGTHIQAIIENPELFGVSSEHIENLYAQYNEPVTFEGKAREELIKAVAQIGWVRVRHYRGRNDYWSIQADSTYKRGKVIKAFIRWAQSQVPPLLSNEDTVIIMGYNDPNDIKRFDFMNGGVGKYLLE